MWDMTRAARVAEWHVSVNDALLQVCVVVSVAVCVAVCVAVFVAVSVAQCHVPIDEALLQCVL